MICLYRQFLYFRISTKKNANLSGASTPSDITTGVIEIKYIYIHIETFLY